MALHLVRHGESEWNLAGRVQGQSPDAGSLTPAGRAQARRRAESLAELPGVEGIISSDLARARETADIIGAVLGLPVGQDPGLREQQLGALEGSWFADTQDVIDSLWRHPDRHPPGGESISEMYVRVHRTLGAYAGRELILVTHGGPIRMATAPEDPRLGAAVPRRPVGNATVVTLSRERVTARCFSAGGTGP